MLLCWHDECTNTAAPSTTMDGYRARMRRLGWTSRRKAGGSRAKMDGCPDHPVVAGVKPATGSL